MSVRLEDLNKSFGTVQVLAGINLEIRKGELFSVVGPSGSGKTTLLRVVAGLEAQDAGHVYIDGKVVDGLDPSKRNIGMVFQNYALYPNRTVLDNIASPLLVRGVKKAEAYKEAEEMATKLGIDTLLHKHPGEISGGQQQRVALARSLVKKPDVFLLDEPLSNLDAQLRFAARKFVKDVQREFGITTVYVTHDQSEALSISDRVAIIDRGRIQQVGTPKEVYQTPANEFVAGFLGAPPLNVVELTCENGAVKPITVPLPGHPIGKVRVGLRPEDIVIGSGENEAEVREIEYSGRESVVYLDASGLELRSLATDVSQLKVGQKVKFTVLQRGVLVFNGGGGK